MQVQVKYPVLLQQFFNIWCVKIYVPNGQRKYFYIFDSTLNQRNIYKIETFKISYTICAFFLFKGKGNLNVMFFTLTVITVVSFTKTDNLNKKILYFRDIERKEYPPCYRRFSLKKGNLLLNF